IGDDWIVIAWEAAMLDAMGAAGIAVPEHSTNRITVDGTERTVLFLRRFDRAVGGIRIPYISAMTGLEATDGSGGDWVDLIDFARISGADTAELWRRAAFGALVGNLDDHLRNHGFLRRGANWALSPAFDVNPEPLDDGNQHQLALIGNTHVDLDALMSKDSLALFSVRRPAALAFLEQLRPLLIALPRHAAIHGADARSISVMSSRIHNAVAAVS
ncbi:MAG: hypothetical protein JWQ43_2152, partial [Glaciihabitans sp.]|nr:hypothetical protein [Glaciihabitans sp.]